MEKTVRVIFFIFVGVAVISLIASLLLCGNETESKNARKTAVYSMVCGIIISYVTWVFWG